jgi:ABC-type uncharacterized transport system YnjBCD ATPase subunit
MTWLPLIAAVISAIVSIIKSMEGRGSIDSALAAAILKGLRESDDAIKQAQDARKAVRDSIAAKPDSVSDDDGFRRD